MTRYILEIYKPGSDGNLLAMVETDCPIPVAVGEYLGTGGLVPDHPHTVLLVTRVEHGIWHGVEGWTHKRMVFTAADT